jgi:hypothetical protein
MPIQSLGERPQCRLFVFVFAADVLFEAFLEPFCLSAAATNSADNQYAMYVSSSHQCPSLATE